MTSHIVKKETDHRNDSKDYQRSCDFAPFFTVPFFIKKQNILPEPLDFFGQMWYDSFVYYGILQFLRLNIAKFQQKGE